MYSIYRCIACICIACMLSTTCIASSIPVDKQLHGLAGITISGISATMGMTTEETLYAALYIGVAKECYDNHTGGTVEVEDVIATVIGAYIGILLIQAFSE